ncbi:hypothetical protein BGZ76_000937 [Entomortierella beljakovae]|nr:hypothetical protein BGZ76_000937 [Entomortierella beljakovae]
MASASKLKNGSNPTEEQPPTDMTSPIISDLESDNVDEPQPARSPTLTPVAPQSSAVAQNSNITHAPPSFHHDSSRKVLRVPNSLRRNNSASFMGFNEIPTLPTFLSNCNLSEYLKQFNEAGATDDSMPLIIDFDDDELKSIMDVIPMKPFHAITFRKGIRDLRERSRMGSMHFDNPQNSFMQTEPHGMLHYSDSQFFQQPSQPSQSSQHSQTSHPSQSSLNSSQLTRGYSYNHHGSSQTPGLYRQSSNSKSTTRRSNYQASSTSQSQGYIPTPSQVLSGGSLYQYVGPARIPEGAYAPQAIPLFPHEQPVPQRSSTKVDRDRLKRRRSSSGSPTGEVMDPTFEDSSPVIPDPCSMNSSSSSSWGNGTPNASASSNTQDPATMEMILQQSQIYGKNSSRSLTKYEKDINEAARKLAIDDPNLLTNKGLLWKRARAKLLVEDYDYKRGKSRSKLPEAEKKKDQKASKERLIQKREANASNAASIRLRRITSLGEHYHRKTAEREALLATLLRIESPEYKQANPETFESEATKARDDLTRVEEARQVVAKELGSLKNKERKHQWYENRKKKQRVGDDEPSEQDEKCNYTGTDIECEGGTETDTTVDPEGDASQRSAASKQGAAGPTLSQSSASKAETVTSKPLTWKAHNPTVATTTTNNSENGKSPLPRPKKHKDIFRTSEYTPAVKS